jgi:exonuclease VII small subunit
VKGTVVDDETILELIERLSNEEQELEESHRGEPLSKAQRDRLQDVEVQLDQAYDLLRQRRARRTAGQDPDEASVRPEGVVENYLQ